MHKCVCIWRYILQNYNYKLHFQNLSIYHISHVFIRTLAAENLDVCTDCDPWYSNIQLTIGKDRRWKIYPNVVQCLILTLVDCHRKCHSNRKLTTMQNKWPISPGGTWWCGVWTHICQHCSLWWSLLQWHVDPISWWSTTYHCTILLIDWDCTTKGLARPLWVPAYDLQYY